MKIPKKATADTSKYPQLPEMQPLLVEVEIPGKDDKPNPQYLKEKFNNEDRQVVQIRMRVVEGPFAGDGSEDHPAGKIWGKHGATLGTRKGGEPSMLRQLVTAARPDLIRGLDEDAAKNVLADFELDEMQGDRLIVIGRYDPTDTDRTYLKPIAYSAAPPDKRRGAAGSAVASANEGYQISPDGLYRFREGMANWELIPAAPAPPPPPPVAAAPPPPAPPAQDNGYQYSPDGKLRWKDGMAAWESVPTVAPPPPPAAVAPPPLPTGPPALPTATAPPPPPTAPAPGRADF